MKHVFYFIFFLLFSTTFCRITKFKIDNDDRDGFLLRDFGFNKKGTIKFNIKFLEIDSFMSNPPDVGFVIQKIDDEDFDQLDWPNCPNNFADNFAIIAKQEDWKKGFVWQTTINETQEGEYSIYYRNCESSQVSFDIVLTLYNEGPNYLSAGEFPLPGIYLLFFLLYLSVTSLWIMFLVKNRKKTRVNRVHILMSVLLVSKMLAMLCKSIEYYYIKNTGLPNGWNYPYYIFAIFKGILLFIVLLFIGTGWAFIKRSLSSKEKKLFAIIIPLQWLDNMAMVIVSETTQASKEWTTWETLFRLIDIICVCLILFPIVWSINHLKSVASIDGKVAKSLEKLKLFRQFYILTVAFIYFTRIILILFERALTYQTKWVSPFFDELATFLFFIYIGYKFRPEPNNPYLRIGEVDEESSEEDDIDAINLDDFSFQEPTLRNLNENSQKDEESADPNDGNENDDDNDNENENDKK
ncbi:transmembrane receptor [Anaeramoeba ignava]|uniref:Transmembrane receptor n=1 Tax=Anaeramoeba ignava TaxID=1746090 RepID=A0A9Q0RAY4_ANAIG|nr:transmembrane receptor [Anaeramoeba ignava]